MVFSGDIFTCCVVAILIFIKTGLLLNLKTWKKDKEHLAVQVQPTEGHIIQKDSPEGCICVCVYIYVESGYWIKLESRYLETFVLTPWY
jgi:hypothetical protein